MEFSVLEARWILELFNTIRDVVFLFTKRQWYGYRFSALIRKQPGLRSGDRRSFD